MEKYGKPCMGTRFLFCFIVLTMELQERKEVVLSCFCVHQRTAVALPILPVSSLDGV